MGLCFYNIVFIFSYESIYPQECDINVVLQIINIKEEKEYVNKYVAKVIENKKITSSKNTKVILYTKKDSNFYPGDIITVSGKFEKAEKSRNYGGFNYRNYLKQQKIYGIINSDSEKLIQKKLNFNIVLENIRLNIFNKINNIYKNTYADFLRGILIGKTDNIDEEIKNDFKDSNISHILAISGLHVSYVIFGINFFLKQISKNKKSQNIFMIVFLFIFAFLTGFSASCIRACIMGGITLISSNLYRKSNIYINILFSFIIILFINPFNIYNIGMWLSFLGTLGIVIFNDFLFKIVEKKLKNNKLKKYYFYILKIVLVTISAQILIFPIMIYFFNTISLNFFISNFLISFFIGPILILGYISVLLSYIKFPGVKFIVIIEEKIIFCILKIASLCSKMPFSKIYVTTPNFIIIILYYVTLLVIIYFVKKRKFYFFRFLFSIKYIKKEIKKFKKILLRILIIVIIITNINVRSDKLKIYFIDVGQGDCTVIQTPNGKNLIIDGGEGNNDKYDYGEKVVLPYLLDRKIKNIDYLIISHADSDHIRTDYLLF